MAKDYSKLEKNDLLKVIEKLESRKKYGLIWDEEKTREKFEKESENSLPVLKEIKGKEIKTDPTKPINILIEGDNYHALSVLNYTHQGKVDVIYIDPPYNTGKEDFKYNDRYVDKEDAYRHSKWLSFMIKRLRLAKNLLQDSGIIFISIGDDEIAQLKMLCNEIFGEDNFISAITIYSNPRGRQSTNDVALTHEYLLVYSKSNLGKLDGEELSSEKIKEYNLEDKGGMYREIGLRLRGGRATAEESPTLHFPIYVDPKSKNIFLEKKRGYVEIIPKFEDGTLGTWRWSKKTILEDIHKLLARQVKSKGIYRWDIFEKDYLSEDKKLKVKSVWLDKEINYDNGADEIKDLFHKKVFDYAKPTALIKKIINISAGENALILDFMAGSGTTGHSVLLFNKEMGGNRSFILSTNNENNICTDICYPRIQKAIKGYKTLKGGKIEGLGGNLKYLKTAFVKNSISQDDMKMRITRECTEMLCLRESIFEEKKKKDDYRIFEQNGRVMAVYYALEREALAALKKDLDKMDGDKILYCFTLDPLGLDKEDFAEWSNVSLEPIPQKILDIYEQIYEY